MLIYSFASLSIVSVLQPVKSLIFGVKKGIIFLSKQRGYIGMNKTELKSYIQENYSAEPEYPWIQHPNHTVFRHNGNKKWFALIMDLPKNKLGLQEDERLDVVNFKCAPLLLDSLLGEKGFFPAYHMSKANWITVALDGSVSDDKIKMLLDMSFDLTSPKIPKNKN